MRIEDDEDLIELDSIPRPYTSSQSFIIPPSRFTSSNKHNGLERIDSKIAEQDSSIPMKFGSFVHGLNDSNMLDEDSTLL